MYNRLKSKIRTRNKNPKHQTNNHPTENEKTHITFQSNYFPITISSQTPQLTKTLTQTKIQQKTQKKNNGRKYELPVNDAVSEVKNVNRVSRKTQGGQNQVGPADHRSR